MRYLYLDETFFDQPSPHLGYGALVTDDCIDRSVVDSAIAALREDPDILDPKTERFDRATLARGGFHASVDSKNAHSHFCKSINGSIKGEFLYTFLRRDVAEAATEQLELAAWLSSLSGLHTREPVKMMFENRGGVTLPVLERWRDGLYENLLRIAYEQPWNPIYFPKIELAIDSKSNAGLQVADFMLWACNRRLGGKDHWFERLGARIASHFQVESGRWGGAGLVLKSGLKRDDEFYGMEHYQEDGKWDDNRMADCFLFAQQLINFCYRNGCSGHVEHLQGEIADAFYARKEHGVEAVLLLCRAYIKLFDMLPVIGSSSVEADKCKLLMSKKYLGLALRKDLIHGVRTADFFARVKRNLIRRNPNLLEQCLDVAP